MQQLNPSGPNSCLLSQLSHSSPLAPPTPNFTPFDHPLFSPPIDQINKTSKCREYRGQVPRQLLVLHEAPAGGQIITDFATHDAIKECLREIAAAVPPHPDYAALASCCR